MISFTSPRRLLGALAIGAAAMGWTAQVADAGTVSAGRSCPHKDKAGVVLCTTAVQFEARPGEVNRVTVNAVEDGGVVVADTGVGTSAGAGCLALDAHRVRCIPSGEGGAEWNTTVSVHTGDRDDTVVCHEPRYGEFGVVANGGVGSDRLECSAVSYADRATPVEVNLWTGTGGSEGELDTLVGVSSVSGGRAADVLFGSRGDDELSGGPGHDAISGLTGQDTIIGGSGDDLISGDAGGDRAFGGSGDDIVRGGAGADHLAGGAGNDRLTGDAGADTLEGNQGDDRFFTRDRSRDMIRGGRGRDSAVRDRRDRGRL